MAATIEPALAFDASGLIGGVMQSAIQLEQQRQAQERLQVERQQQLQFERQLLLQRLQIEAEQRRAAAIASPGWAPAPPPAAAPATPPVRMAPAAIDGRSLGQVLSPDTLPADFRCHPSEQFAGFQWCRSRKAVNGVWTSTSIILSPANAVAYYSKFYESAVFQAQAVAGEIDRLSTLHHEQGRVLHMPGTSHDEGAVIATWGAMTLTPLDASTVNALSGGESVSAGVLVDFLNNIRDSARRGLPVYRLAGGPGYYWIAHYGREGKGNLRFGIADAQSFDLPKPPPMPPVVVQASPAPSSPPPAPAPTVVAAATIAPPSLSDVTPAPSAATLATVSPAPTDASGAMVPPPPPAVSDGPPQGKRVALVIGNSDYEAVPHLDNPRRDAEAMADALRSAGFDSVTLVKDATLPEMKKALRELQDQADTADWAMIYYAGHGIEIGGVNYLIPVDAHLVSDRDADDEAVPLENVLSRLDGVKKLRLVVLDACRENPFGSTVQRHGANRDITRGLARFDPPVANEMVVYAAKDHQLAQDGSSDGHSPFAKALLARLATPKLEINRLFRLVTNDVEVATNNNQQPFVYGSTPGLDDFYFRTQ